jgi:F0F1-type ATP synthase membrane subunit b/b'
MASATQGNLGEKKMDQAREQFNQGKENMKDAASSAAQGIGQKAQETAARLGQKAHDVASSAQDKTDDALSTVGQKVSNLAGTLRSSAPQEGVVGSTANALANKLDSTGRYLQEHGIGDMGEDLAQIVKSHPIPSMLAIFGVGFLAGMAARR